MEGDHQVVLPRHRHGPRRQTVTFADVVRISLRKVVQTRNVSTLQAVEVPQDHPAQAGGPEEEVQRTPEEVAPVPAPGRSGQLGLRSAGVGLRVLGEFTATCVHHSSPCV